MGGDFFDGGAEAVGPVGGEDFAGDVDAFLFGVGPGELGEKGEVFLEKVDVEEAGAVVGIAQDLEVLVRTKVGGIFPLFECSKGLCFLGIGFPPEEKGF